MAAAINLAHMNLLATTLTAYLTMIFFGSTDCLVWPGAGPAQALMPSASV
jgi:hypothetical protein